MLLKERIKVLNSRITDLDTKNLDLEDELTRKNARIVELEKEIGSIIAKEKEIKITWSKYAVEMVDELVGKEMIGNRLPNLPEIPEELGGVSVLQPGMKE